MKLRAALLLGFCLAAGAARAGLFDDDEARKEIAALKETQTAQIESVQRKAALDAQADREKIVQLETSLREEESRNSELDRQVKALMEDNLNKDRTIASLT